MWMIYGANGYTGELIAREAARRGMRPILAGRSAERVEPLARELGLESRVFPVTQPKLDGVRIVLHCAGPFIRTSGSMVRACLDAGAHYLDITGEIEVFESVLAQNDEATRRGVVLIPGVGFDVVPTDCLGAMLAQRLPDANELWLAFSSGAGLSRGTIKTMIEGAGEGGAIRRDGKIVRVPMLFDVREIPFKSKPRLAMTIPWGDVATSYHTTGIPNIRVYAASSRRAIARSKRLAMLMPLMRIGFVKRVMQKLVDRREAGPDAEQRARARIELWGRVVNSAGNEMTMTMSTPEGYTFTMLSTLAAVERLLNEPPRAGAYTPARYFGADFVRSIEGVVID